MKCICPHCGKSHNSGDLCFNFSEILEVKLTEALDKMKDSIGDPNYSVMLDTLCNRWKVGGGESPFLLKERNIVKWTRKAMPWGGRHPEGAQNLKIPSSDWLELLRAWKQKEKALPIEAMPLVEKLLNRKVKLPDLLLNEQVVLFREDFQDGPDAVQITSIQIQRVKLKDGFKSRLINTRYCPNCGGQLSKWAGRYPEVVMTVLGGPRASKSSVLAACANLFANNADYFKIRWTVDENEVGWKDFYEQSLEPYQRGWATKPTSPLEGAPAPRFSALVRLARGDKKRDSLVLTVVDLPGELFNPSSRNLETLLERYRELYTNIDCIWYCADYAEVAHLPKEKWEEYGYTENTPMLSTNDALDMFDRMKSLFRRETPTAFILGKSDRIPLELPDINEEWKQLLCRPDYRLGSGETRKWMCVNPQGVDFCPCILTAPYYSKSLNIRDFLYAKNSALIEHFEETFPAHTYIATSSYGRRAVDEDEKGKGAKAEPLNPFQPELPFLWMLATLGYIDIQCIIQQGKKRHIQLNRADGQLNRSSVEYKIWRNLCMYGEAARAFIPEY